MAVAGSLVVTISAKTADFEASMRKTTATLKFTEQQAAQVSQAFGKLGDSFTSVGSKASRTSSAMQDLKGSLLGLAAGVLSFQAITRAIEGSVQAALRLEALNTAFTVITGSAKGAAQAMQFVRETADRLGVQVNDLAGGYKTLLAATEGTKMSGEAVKNLFLGITEAGRAMSLSSEDIAGALRPIGQILNQQAIQGDEWRNEFGSRIPKAMQLLLEATNGAVKSQGELSKAMEEGKLKGEVVFDIMNNVGELLRSKYTPAAMQAAQGTQASFERLQTAVTDLAAAFGQGLAPALAEAARALTAFISQGRDGAGILGDSLLPIIRQITSVLLGLAGAFVVTGKAIAAFSVGLIGDTEAARIGWQDVGDTISNTLALQEKMLAGGFAAAPGAQAAAPAAKLKPITLGAGTDAGKAATRTAAEKESERIAERQKDLVTEIANAYDAANNALESGVELERTRLEQRLRAAQFSQADLETLMATYDATERLLEQRKTDEKLAGDRLQLSTQLQESLDKQLFTERELLQRKLTAIGFSKEEAALKLKMFDTEVRLREEAEQRKEAEQDALAATKEHLATLARLQEQLQPRVRQTRAQELQGTISEMAEETSDPFTLAQADIQRQATLRTEWLDSIFKDLEQMGEEVASTFVDMATTGEFSFKRLADSFSRMAIEMVADAIGLKEAIGSWIKAGVQAMGGQALGGSGGGLFGLFGGGAGAGMEAGAGAITQTPFGGGGGAFGAEGMSFAFGGGMAAGGPVMPGKFYTVGERGPETLVAGGPGRIIPNGGGGGMNVTMNIVTNDANSFRLNERQIAAQAARTLSRARRNL